MNEHDRANLEFLLAADAATIAHWMSVVGKDDIAYAEELLARAKVEVEMQLLDLNDHVEDVSDAKAVLDKIAKR